MNAQEAKELAAKADQQKLDAERRDWEQIKEHIFSTVLTAATDGKTQFTFDLRATKFIGIQSSSINFISAELEKLGYTINRISERSPMGRRVMVVVWGKEPLPYQKREEKHRQNPDEEYHPIG